MKNLIEILPNIYGVKVPNAIEQFHIGTLDKQILGFTRDYIFWESYIILYENFKIIGTITATEISFDFEEMFGLDWDAFRSALPKEIYFENPFVEPDHLKYKHLNEWNEYVFTPINLERYSEDYNQWQTAQQNITEKLLILQKTN